MKGDRKYEELEEREKVRQRDEKWGRIRKSRFDMWYECKGGGNAKISGEWIGESR